MNRRLVSVACLAISLHAAAGPFGLSPGMSLREVKTLTGATAVPNGAAYIFHGSKVPVPHEAFESYGFFVTPKAGLCKVTAMGKTMKTSVYGDGLKQAFEALKSPLTEKYGEPKSYDYLRGGSIWNEPKDWMMGLMKEERRLAAFWSKNQGSTLAEDTQAIALVAKALRTDSGYVTLTYEFSNLDDCLAEAKSSSKDAL